MHAGRPVTAAWILQLELAGQKINLPAYVMPTAGAEAQIGPAKIVFCLAPPDIPVDKGGAANGAKFISADLTVNGVFSPVSVGARGCVLDAVAARQRPGQRRRHGRLAGGRRTGRADGQGREVRSRSAPR